MSKLSGKAALLCLVALLALVATQATAESVDVTSIASSGVPRRMLLGFFSKYVVVHGSKTVEAAPAPAAADSKVVVVVPYYCKGWSKFGHIHPGCWGYYKSAGRKLQALQ